MSDRQREQGFSLLEMIVVVSVMMILVGFATPTILTAVRNYRLSGTASGLTRLLQQARSTAIRQGSPACAVLAGTLYGIDANCDGTIDGNSIVLPPGYGLTNAGPGPTGMNFSSPPVPLGAPFMISFTARGGTGIAPAVGMIYLTGGGNTGAITVTGGGRPRSWSYAGGSWH